MDSWYKILFYDTCQLTTIPGVHDTQWHTYYSYDIWESITHLMKGDIHMTIYDSEIL